MRKPEYTKEEVEEAFTFAMAGLNGSNTKYPPASKELFELVLEKIKNRNIEKENKA